MFASQVTKDVTVADGTRFTIRKLNWKTLDRARDARSGSDIAQLRNMGGDVLKALRSDELSEAAAAIKKRTADEKAEAKRKARYAAYDRGIVLEVGIKGWSLPDEVTPEKIADLPDEIAQQLFEAVVDLSVPEPEKAKEAEGNG